MELKFEERKETLLSEVKSKLVFRLSSEHKWLLQKAEVDANTSKGRAVIDLFDGSKCWGWWDRKTRRIGLSEQLVMQHPWNVVLGILAHETAHQLADIFWPNRASEGDHDLYFKMACDQLGVHPFYRKANVDLMEGGPPPSIFNRMDPDVPDHPVLDKVRKLLALSTSPEPNEAAQALAMASRLMARHNIDESEVKETKDGCPYERWRIPLETTRISSVDMFISNILADHFFVKIVLVWEYSQKAMKALKELEFLGRPVNLHMAKHVFYYLRERSESLWQANKASLALMGEKGIGAKNAFIGSMLEALSEKLKASEEVPFQGQVMPSSSLILARDTKLQEFMDEAHPRLTKSYRGSGTYAPNSARAGEKVGKDLNIYSPVSAPTGRGGGYLEDRR